MRSLFVSPCRKVQVWVITLTLLFAITGCGEQVAVVSGEVQIAGVPVENGTISFESVDKNTPSMGGPITAGRYSVTGTPGKKIVRVNSFRLTGKKVPAGPPMPPGTLVDEIEMFPPAGKSHEVKEVELKAGVNDFSVQLTAPPAGLTK